MTFNSLSPHRSRNKAQNKFSKIVPLVGWSGVLLTSTFQGIIKYSLNQRQERRTR